MKYEINYCQEKINHQWDTFVNENDGELFQTTAWANYDLKFYGRNTARFYVKESETIVGGCQITIFTDEILGKIGVVRSGPCFKVKTPELMSLIVKELKKCIKSLRLTYLIVTPDYSEYDLIPFFEREEFETQLFPNLPPYKYSTLRENVLYLDLNPSIDEIFKQIDRQRRRRIRRGLESPFKVKFGGREDLKTFFDLYMFTARKHKYTDPITNKKIDYLPTKDSYEEYCILWDELAPKGWIKLFLGTVEDEIICANLVYSFGKTFRLADWGWKLKYKEYHISDVMYWEMIQWAKTNSFQNFDFYYINPIIAETYKSSAPIPESLKELSTYGPTIYKMSFGGTIMNAPGIFIYYSDEMKHLIETSSDDLQQLLKLYKDFYWRKLNFFRDRDINFHL